MELAEAKARIARLEGLAGELVLLRPTCTELAVQVGCLMLPVSTRLVMEVWAGPAAERAFAGLQGLMTQAARGRREVESLDGMVGSAADVARQVAAELGQAVRVAEQAGLLVVEDRFSGWPAGRDAPRGPDPEPPPTLDLAAPAGGVTGVVGINLVSGPMLAADLATTDNQATGLRFAIESLVSRFREALDRLARDVTGLPRTCSDLDWLRVGERLRMAGGWADHTRKDLVWRIAAVGAASMADGAGMVSTTLVFPDPQAASRATTADADAIEAIVDRKPWKVGGVATPKTSKRWPPGSQAPPGGPGTPGTRPRSSTASGRTGSPKRSTSRRGAAPRPWPVWLR